MFTPGDDFHYSGFDNILLSAVMQQASDQPFDDFMTGEVFSPLGLKVTGPDHLRSKDQPFAQSIKPKARSLSSGERSILVIKLRLGAMRPLRLKLRVSGRRGWMMISCLPVFVKPSGRR